MQTVNCSRFQIAQQLHLQNKNVREITSKTFEEKLFFAKSNTFHFLSHEFHEDVCLI